MDRDRMKLSAKVATALLLVMTCALFALDVFAPGGVAEGYGYAVALILCLWVPGRWTLTATAVAMTVLVLAGIFIGQRGAWGFSG
jgi:hypothetical protein